MKRVFSEIMFIVLSAGMLLLVFNINRACSEELPQPEWPRSYGGSNQDWAFSVVETSDGGYAVLGATFSFGAGADDFWLVKTDVNGNMQWNKTYGGTGEDRGRSILQTDDGGYAIAGHTGDFRLIKTDATGNMQWSKTYGGAGSEDPWSVVKTSDGGYAVAGVTDSFGAGGYDFWLVKTDVNGNMQWNKTYGGAEWDWAFSVVQTNDGGYAVAGYTVSFGAGGYDFWLVKTDATGNMQWNKTYGGVGDDDGRFLVQTSDAGYAIAGDTSSVGAGGLDSWLVKTDSMGNMQWNRTYGGIGYDTARSIVQTGNGGFALAGFTESFGAGGRDFWLVKTDATGNMQWNKTYGGTEEDFAWAMIQTEDKGYVLTGYTASFSAGDVDFWLVKVTAEGVPAIIDIDRSTDSYPSFTWIVIGAVLIATGITAFFGVRFLDEHRRKKSQARPEEEARSKAERQLAAEREQQRMKTEEEQRRVAVKQNADNFKEAGRYEDAAKLYEQLAMWDEAGECRRLARTTYVVAANVHVGKDGISVNCPHCGSSERLASKVSDVTCRHCGMTYYIPRKILDTI